MMADMAVESSRFVALCDERDLDEAELPHELSAFNSVLHQLFVSGQCVHIPGLTGVMLKVLRRPRTFILNGTPHSFGRQSEIPAEVVTRCLKRMASTTLLCSHVMAAEFPESDLLASFRIFATSKEKSSSEYVHDTRKCLSRIAAALSLPLNELESEFFHFLPRAHKRMKVSPCTTLEAWAREVLAVQQRKSLREADKTDIVPDVSYNVINAYTCGHASV